MSTTKGAPRFVPTLTEVFNPDRSLSAAELEMESLIAKVSQRVISTVITELRDSMQALLQEQMCKLEADLRKEIDVALQRAALQYPNSERDV